MSKGQAAGPALVTPRQKSHLLPALWLGPASLLVAGAGAAWPQGHQPGSRVLEEPEQWMQCHRVPPINSTSCRGAERCHWLARTAGM